MNAGQPWDGCAAVGAALGAVATAACCSVAAAAPAPPQPPPRVPQFQPPYTAVIFSSLRTSGDDSAYGVMGAEMAALAAQQPGYLGAESARDPDGFGLTVSYWRSNDDAVAWKQVARHGAAQRQGRDEWYR